MNIRASSKTNGRSPFVHRAHTPHNTPYYERIWLCVVIFSFIFFPGHFIPRIIPKVNVLTIVRLMSHVNIWTNFCYFLLAHSVLSCVRSFVRSFVFFVSWKTKRMDTPKCSVITRWRCPSAHLLHHIKCYDYDKHIYHIAIAAPVAIVPRKITKRNFHSAEVRADVDLFERFFFFFL